MLTYNRFLFSVILQLHLSASSPIVLPPNFQPPSPGFGSDFCFLPIEFGSNSKITFLEDCNSLDRFETLPKPADQYRKFGIHPRVCCPEYLDKEHICFPTDPWCPSYQEPPPPEYDADYADEYEAVEIISLPLVSEQNCKPYGQFVAIEGVGELSQCVTHDRCSALIDVIDAPATRILVCGYEESSNKMMICCPPDLVTDSTQNTTQAARFPKPDGSVRKVEDKTSFCRKWKRNGGCDLDKEHIFSEKDPNNGRIQSPEMFEFMQSSCMDTCGWADNKGCVDEHPRCQEWAKLGLCTINAPLFMIHTCRESCGVCGFLSHTNTEEQVVDGLSYSDYNKENFDCGRYQQLCEINGEGCDSDLEAAQPDEDKSRVKRQVDSNDLKLELFSFDATLFANNKEAYFCGATLITDKFLVAAAHCYQDFGNSPLNNQININTIRDNTQYRELVEIKKVYTHPSYSYPSLYTDIAVVELGRRVEYDFKKFGDSPTCLDQGDRDINGELSTVQGYGLTEDGERGNLLEANVTIISNDLCKEFLRYNVSQNDNGRIKKEISGALKNGLNFGLLCAQGMVRKINGKDVFTGSCKGDSGGPLKSALREKDTLIGIVSGGIGCGLGIPNWFTKVSYYTRWIDCIIKTSIETGSVKYKVEEKCNKIAEELTPTCIDDEDLIFDLRISDDENKIPSCDPIIQDE